MTERESGHSAYERGARLEPNFLPGGIIGKVNALDESGEHYSLYFIGTVAQKNVRRVLRLIGISPPITFPDETLVEKEVIVQGDIIKKGQPFELESYTLLANSAFRAVEIWRPRLSEPDQRSVEVNSPEPSSPSE